MQTEDKSMLLHDLHAEHHAWGFIAANTATSTTKRSVKGV